MSDDVGALLRWLHAHDLPREVVLACEHSPADRPGRRHQLVVWKGCLSGAPIGVPAQLLALGVERVSVLPCPLNSEGVLAQVRRWQSLTPGLVAVAETKRAIWRGPNPCIWADSPAATRAPRPGVARCAANPHQG